MIAVNQDKIVISNKDTAADEVSAVTKRLLSLDFFRGFTMFFLIASATRLYEIMQTSGNGFVSALGWQFEHRYWHGLTFYDFIEPFFMFIVGVAIPFSVMKRLEKGEKWNKIFTHVLQRSVILFFLGIVDYSVGAAHPVWRLWSVLTQVSVTYMLAFLLMRKPIKIQLLVSFVLILISFLFYRFWSVAGYDQPYVADHNFGSWFDMKVMGVLEGDHWVSFNVVPTAAFTIWGVVAGLILKSDRTYQQKIIILVIAGIIGIIAGVALDPVIPMIKRIATASITLLTGGACLLALAFSYWAIDIKKVHRIPMFFAIVGMNPLFIYLFAQIGGASFLSHIAKPFAYALFFWTNERGIEYGTAIITWFGLWYLCYWLYKHKIFIKI